MYLAVFMQSENENNIPTVIEIKFLGSGITSNTFHTRNNTAVIARGTKPLRNFCHSYLQHRTPPIKKGIICITFPMPNIPTGGGVKYKLLSQPLTLLPMTNLFGQPIGILDIAASVRTAQLQTTFLLTDST